MEISVSNVDDGQRSLADVPAAAPTMMSAGSTATSNAMFSRASKTRSAAGTARCRTATSSQNVMKTRRPENNRRAKNAAAIKAIANAHRPSTIGRAIDASATRFASSAP